LGGERASLQRAAALVVTLVALLFLAPPLGAQDNAAPAALDGTDPAVARGGYVFRAAGCLTCHTDAKGGGAPLAGGRALVTPFGTFYSPNITSDPKTGIGAWSEADFLAALRHGTSPAGDPYYPAFPYPSYSGMSDQDLRDLFAYLLAQPPVASANRPHELDFPFNLRFTLGVWQALFFQAGAFQPDPGRDARWNRGAYLVRHLGHCGECHSPRGLLGEVDGTRELGGNPQGPDGDKVPNLTPGPGGLAGWSESDIAYALKNGITPDGDFLADSMGEVIDNGLRHLTEDDLAAIAKYIKELAPQGGS